MKRVLCKAAGVLARLLAAITLLLLGFAAWKLWHWPDVAALAEEDPATTSIFEARRARGEKVEWRYVPYAAISSDLKRAVLVAEDIDFFSHRGFATGEIRTAIEETVREGRRLRGASTITQQLARNLWLSTDRSLLRKLEEAILTTQLERNLDKRRILELYLNVVEFGPGLFGAEAAARHYYGKPASQLDAQEGAALAAGLPHSQWHPGAESRAYRAHRDRVLRRMEKARWIEKEL
jgi:monofunctional biosynthetic peptidoglycan transglycosylase